LVKALGNQQNRKTNSQGGPEQTTSSPWLRNDVGMLCSSFTSLLPAAMLYSVFQIFTRLIRLLPKLTYGDTEFLVAISAKQNRTGDFLYSWRYWEELRDSVDSWPRG
tara:strand:- start:27 stop:347 length:321 start_codon:yes stop_codon:yes gene_type:complete